MWLENYKGSQTLQREECRCSADALSMVGESSLECLLAFPPGLIAAVFTSTTMCSNW